MRLRRKTIDNKIAAEQLRRNGLIQTVGRLLTADGKSACALGQLAVNMGYTGRSAAGRMGSADRFQDKLSKYPGTYKCDIFHEGYYPDIGYYSAYEYSIAGLIIHLNDDHNLTFKEIADKIEALPPFKITLERGLFA